MAASPAEPSGSWYFEISSTISKIAGARSPGSAPPDIRQGARRLKLTGRYRIDHETDLGLEHAARYGLEQNLGLVASPNPLQGVLLERGREGFAGARTSARTLLCEAAFAAAWNNYEDRRNG